AALRRTRPGARPEDAAEFRRRFDLMSLQRNLKALGTFGFQAATRGNAAYLQYVPRTLAHVRTNLERYPRFRRLRRVLATPLPALRRAWLPSRASAWRILRREPLHGVQPPEGRADPGDLLEHRVREPRLALARAAQPVDLGAMHGERVGLRFERQE